MVWTDVNVTEEDKGRRALASIVNTFPLINECWTSLDGLFKAH